MLREMLKLENVRILEKTEDWRRAIHESLKTLVDGGYVESRYIDNIIESTVRLGPYYVLAEDVALIHGRPEEGVLKKQLAVTVLRKPVRFSENGYPVRILIALAAEDSESHLDVMKIIATILMDESKIQAIANGKTEEEIYQLFLNAEEEIEE